MTLSRSELTALAELASEAATTAGEMIARSRPAHIEHKASGSSPASQVVTEVDRRSESIILNILRPALQQYKHGLLTEEQPDDGGRFRADYFWCIDPLDGTLPFIEGTPGYAVSIALVRRDGTPVIGVVCDPVKQSVLSAIAGEGVYRDGRPWAQPPSTGMTLTLYTDRSFLSCDGYELIIAGLQTIAAEMGRTGVEVDTSSGAVMNACRVLANPPACYVKRPKTSGGGSLWDYAATACIFREAGAAATDMSGRPFELNRSDSTFMCHRGIVFAGNEDLAQRIQALCG